MPIVGFYCQKCRVNVPVTHFEDGCTYVHPDFAAAVVADSRKDRQPGIHVTSIIGCPRKSAIEQVVDVYVDPLGYNAILGGTGWHKLMEDSSTRPELCEVEVRGTVGGIPLVGRVDRLHPPTAISDWKVTSEWAEKWLMKPKAEGGGMKTEHLAQLSIYAELVEQTLGWRPVHGIVWYRTHKTMLHFPEELWPLGQVLEFHPLDGDYSVGELLGQAAWSADCGTTMECWAELPLAGESMKYGNKTACDYCSVREVCWQQSKGAPF
jgi:hypothetical protein